MKELQELRAEKYSIENRLNDIDKKIKDLEYGENAKKLQKCIVDYMNSEDGYNALLDFIELNNNANSLKLALDDNRNPPFGPWLQIMIVPRGDKYKRDYEVNK